MKTEERRNVEISLDARTYLWLEACAAWRNVSVENLARVYVEDWIDIDYPQSRGRHTRRGIYRDGPIELCERTRQEASRNWIKDLGEEAP